MGPQRHNRTGAWQGWVCWASAWVCCGLATCTSWGAGTEISRRAEDLALSVDSRWVGCDQGGYYPIRIRIANFAAPRDLRFVFRTTESSDRIMPDVVRRMRLETNKTAQFSLSVPMVSEGTSGRLIVYVDGSPVDDLETRHSLSESSAYQGDHPSMLILSNASSIDTKPFQEAVNARVSASSSHHYGGYSGGDDVAVLPLEGLPESWVDYSGVDLIAIRWADYSKLRPAVRQSLKRWLVLGGRLVLTETGAPGRDLKALQPLLAESRVATGDWMACDPSQRRFVAESSSSSYGAPSPAVTVAVDPSVNLKSWGADSTDLFSTLSYGRGAISVFPGNPFPGSRHEWSWFLNSGGSEVNWGMRHGVSPRGFSNEFLNFLIPGVGGVPIYSFLVLITLFAVIIGPVNYMVLARRRQQYLMVLTIPALAFVTSLAMFLYSFVSDGFSIRSRTMSVTWLDPQSNTAFSWGRTALYAPVAPSAGVKFSPDCAVYPIWPQTAGFEGGTLDWSSNSQQFTRGWLRSKTWTQFMTVDAREERGRIELAQPSADGKTLRASNGLTCGLKLLLVRTPGGEIYLGRDLPPGASADLQLDTTGAGAREYADLSQVAEWKYPDGLDHNQQSAMRDFRAMRRGYYYSSNTMPSLTSSPMYQTSSTRDFQSQPGKLVFRGICDRNPGVPVGIENTRVVNDIHYIGGTN